MKERDHNDSHDAGQAGGKRLKKKKMKKGVIALIAVAALLVVCLAAYAVFVRAPEIPGDPTVSDNPGDETGGNVLSDRKDKFYTFLLCGTDDGNGNTDTIMVASYDVENQKLNIVSVPRDTMINVSWSIKKINSAYGVGGVERLEEELSKIIGFHVDYYIKVDLEAFVKVVDTIGGVDFDVPINMNYDDPTQNLHIHIDKGMQHLTGEEAIGVVRFRKGYPDADLGRIKTQQAFLKAVAEQTLRIGNLTKIRQFAEIFSEYVDSDLSVGNMIWFGQQFMKLDSEDISFYTLPNSTGTFRNQSYVTLHEDELLTLVNATLNPYYEDITASRLDIMSILSNGSLSSSTGTLNGDGSAHTTAKPTATPSVSETPTPTEETPEMTATPTATPEPSGEPAEPSEEPTEPSTEPTETPAPTEASAEPTPTPGPAAGGSGSTTAS